MSDPTRIQIPAEIRNESISAFVEEWARVTEPDRIELVSAVDDARLIGEALAAGELLPAGEGRYYARSHPKDTARSEERTVVATSESADRGSYNNWQPASEVKPLITERMRGASRGKTMYVVPYLMAPPGTPLAAYAAGVELTDDRKVVLQMIRMTRVGLEHFDGLSDPDFFVRGVQVTGDPDSLGHGTPEDARLFATIADERTILHYGSAYGGNALLGKIAHGLRQASYDGYSSGKFLAEQFLLLGIRDLKTGATTHVCGGFPSASGKTNLAMTLPPDALGDRYRVDFYGDDIAWMWIDDEGRLRAINPENGAFGVAKDTNERTNPTAMAAIAEGSGTIFTNTAYNQLTGEVWWEGLTPQPPAELDGWLDWTGAPIADRGPDQQDAPWAHPNSRLTIPLERIPNLAADAADPAGVVIDAIIFGGRTRDREPLIRAIDDLAIGVYDGLTLGAEATFAAEGVDGQLRYDPMSMRPFFSYSEGRYAQHWLTLLRQLTDLPVFAHVNWFQRDPEDGHYLWPGYRENLRALNWLFRYRAGDAHGHPTPVGVLPTAEELDLTGLDIPAEDLDRLLRIDTKRWTEEVQHRQEHLQGLPDVPREIWDAHQSLSAALTAQAASADHEHPGSGPGSTHPDTH
ncbi:phosphoenolpyruvate carboxykinase (GTP) [Micrococcus lylae]|uniref:Phosphoenolpyruvate carboxykinase [GTP] n=1 Tax=Micrococcus lylae TaxID=1273 RepID=A0ABY2JXF0_9MICC|nr:phosphoenolpyruvate carboxykinase (GTP) [Micrococcus lylae]MCT2007599.1 phosphoenolpyruvate carboxykinase (GTP) [Micrococcus lylae]MCT2071352.1 phosphoenolpyruvate carboxykinase (GTP) [Micrococcus lylae]TFH98115.1 phosphoenolpyruvate carboxykinase (GTP) [Micrococcus lylae]